jgi:hypothetical protein
MKRLTETIKWDDVWSRKLKSCYRELYHYVCDKADNAGVWQKDWDTFKYHTGWKIDEEEALQALNSDPLVGKKIRIIPIGDKYWAIVGFVQFHYGDIQNIGPSNNKQSRLVQSVWKLIEWHRAKHGYPEEMLTHQGELNEELNGIA